jgi:hypothetical protein
MNIKKFNKLNTSDKKISVAALTCCGMCSAVSTTKQQGSKGAPRPR